MATVQGYPARTSVRAGDKLSFHLSAASNNPLDLIVNQVMPTNGAPPPERIEDVTLPTQSLPASQRWEGYKWIPTLHFSVPADWPSGLYELLGSEQGNDYTICDFVVRAATPGSTSPILLQVGTHTPHAYWDQGGRCFYTDPRGERVSYDRPGALYRDAAPFVAWLEQEGIAVEFCTSHDLHEDGALLDSYDLLLIIGHDEYWSREMREHVERFVRNRGNVAVFSGNTCFRQVRLEGDRNNLMSCFKFAGADHYPDNDSLSVAMALPPVCRPTSSTLGAGFTNGAGCWKDRNLMNGVAFDVRFPDHWVFNGVAAQEIAHGNVGYETDAVAYVEEPEGYPRVTGVDGVPPTYTVLGTADLRDWGPGGKAGMATIGLLVRNGMVFNAASVSWQDALANDIDVRTVTHNVINRLRVRQSWAQWEHIGHANAVSAMTAHDGKLWCATDNDRLSRRFPIGANAPWTELGHAKDVRSMASSAGSLWCVTKDNKLWRRAPVESDANWDLVGTGPVGGTLAIAGTTFLLYAIDSSGRIWIAPTRTPIVWAFVPDMQTAQEPQISCMAAYEDILIAATADGRLLRTGTDFVYESREWALVHHCNFATALAVVDTMLFVTTTEDKIWWLDLRSLRAP